MTMNILVTGAAGFIGSHLCDAHLAAGDRVVGVDCFTDYYQRDRKEANLAHARQQPGFTLLEADLLEADLSQVLRQIQMIYHLAGQPGVRGSWGQNFAVYVRNNIQVTQRLLEAALNTGKVPVVYASSSSAYGNLATMPLAEEMTPAPVSPYGVTKLAAEHLCRLYFEAHGLPTVALRLFTVFGPRQRPDMAFQRFLTALRNGQEIAIYGDGLQTRDFTYVGDVVAALRLAGQRLMEGSVSGQVFNTAGGARVSMRHVLELLREITGRQPNVRYRPAQAGDVRDTWADTGRAQEVLGFSAMVPLREGLARQWAALEQ